jgi:hypothetical protein
MVLPALVILFVLAIFFAIKNTFFYDKHEDFSDQDSI